MLHIFGPKSIIADSPPNINEILGCLLEVPSDQERSILLGCAPSDAALDLKVQKLIVRVKKHADNGNIHAI